MRARAPRSGFLIALVLPLSACIPPSPQFPSERTPARQATNADPQPILVTDMAILSGEPPVWEAEPVRASATIVAGAPHIVQPGETLSGIAERYGTSVTLLAEANQIEPPYALKIGQRLNMPSGRFHRIEPGDTGIGIAKAYGVAWKDVIIANNLSDPFILKIGQRLRIPGTGASQPASATAPLEPHASSSFTLDLEDILTGSEPAEVEASAAVDLPVLTGPQVPVRAPTSFAGSFGWPAQGRLIARYGPAGEGRFNAGVEIGTAPAAPIRASADGVVAFVGNNVAGFGGMILIRHGSGWISSYGRAASTSVRRGQQIKRGDMIGTTGSGSRPQLHFGLRKDGQTIDPLSKLPPV
jgi:murein DD-endopeptidase MepM/ murein hydrolase activator NlpD